jgi:hypothetical protein
LIFVNHITSLMRRYVSCRQTCLSDNPNKPCLLLRFRDATLMLDCGLDLSTAQHFAPIPIVQQQQVRRGCKSIW